MNKRRGNIIIGVVLSILSATFLAYSFKLDVKPGISLLVGPRWVPQLYSSILLLLSLGLLGKSIFQKHPAQKSENEGVPDFPLKVLLIMLIAAVYIWAMSSVGYFVSSAVGFILLLRLLNVRSWVTVLGFTACFLIFVWGIFVNVLMISLPSGFLM
ncbi:MAG: tripartite tricarboxylate transporter TctB family protein [Desulfitobacteriaceae bacterium]